MPRYLPTEDRPLAFHPCTDDTHLAERYTSEVPSGSVAVNDAIDGLFEVVPGIHQVRGIDRTETCTAMCVI